MQEARELANDPSPEYSAAPLEDDIFEWHCTLRGPAGTEFEGGLYHFRILLPAEYPFRPPSLMMLTPNGRFETDTKICISFTSYHEELWQPAWGVRTAIIGLQGFFPLKGKAAVGIGSIEYPTSERKRLAALSRTWTCPYCRESNLDLLPDPVGTTLGNTLGNTLGTTLGQAAPSEASTPVSGPTGSPGTAVLAVANAPHTPNPVVSPAFIEPVADARAAPRAPIVQTISKRQRPPILLDTAICVMLVLACGIVFRRMF
ncbi:non-canonical ubiquitin conjugating enzyme 1 [Mycena latifolia]|nr:non-canonical ubiquitin conjugating enzyme 1 [Mycena latifolia]